MAIKFQQHLSTSSIVPSPPTNAPFCLLCLPLGRLCNWWLQAQFGSSNGEEDAAGKVKSVFVLADRTQPNPTQLTLLWTYWLAPPPRLPPPACFWTKTASEEEDRGLGFAVEDRRRRSRCRAVRPPPSVLRMIATMKTNLNKDPVTSLTAKRLRASLRAAEEEEEEDWLLLDQWVV